jgi:hypothetical protein
LRVWEWVDRQGLEVHHLDSRQGHRVGFLEERRRLDLLDEGDHLPEDHPQVLEGHHLASELLVRLEECRLDSRGRRVKAEGFHLGSVVVK